MAIGQTKPNLSVVIAVRNEARGLALLLADLATAPWLVREVLVSDGDSREQTAVIAELAGAQVLRNRPSRGLQLAHGAATASGEWLLLLHGDVRLPVGWAIMLVKAMAVGDKIAWAFHLSIDCTDPALRLVEWAVSLRSCLAQLPYGDQGLLLSLASYQASGGIAPLPIMEDLEFILRLRQQVQIRCLDKALKVNGRRWQQLGVWQTIVSNAKLRRDWRRGLAEEKLMKRYYSEF